MPSKVKASILKRLAKNPNEAHAMDFSVLEGVIEAADDAYYNTEDPIFTDDTYDLIRTAYDEKNVGVKADSKKRKVGAPVPEFRGKITLPFYLPSLQKMKDDPKALARFIKAYPGPYYISLKLDGMSGLYWRDAEGAYHLSTQGDSKIGSRIDHLLPFLNLKSLKRGEHVRGELIFNRHLFAEKHQHRNCPRSAPPGLINAKDIDEELASDLEFVAFEFYVKDKPLAYSEQMDKLKRRGLQRIEFWSSKSLDQTSLEKSFVEWREKSPYEIDGLVLVNNQVHPRTEDPYAPYARAFKMTLPDQLAESKVVKIHWEDSRYGILTPTIEIEPIRVRNATYTLATAHNAKFILEKKIGPGAEIQMVIAGNVIPAIHKVLKGTKAQMPPKDTFEWADEYMIRSLRPTELSAIRQLVFFWQKLGVKDLGEATLQKLYEDGVTSVRSWIQLRPADIDGLPGIGKKSATKIVKNIKAAIEGANFVQIMAYCAHLGRGIGIRRMMPIFELLHPKPLALFEEDEKSLKAKLTSIKGIGEGVTDQILGGRKAAKKFWKEEIPAKLHSKILENTKDLFVPEPEVEGAEEGGNGYAQNCKGVVALLTGFRDTDLSKEIGLRGGRIVNGWSGKVTVLLVKVLGESNKKTEAAQAKGVPILTPDLFRAQYKIE